MNSSLVFKFSAPNRFYTHSKLKQPVVAQKYHSFSRIWSVASFLERQFKDLTPPNRKNEEDIVINCWCELLCQTVTNEQSYVSGDILRFILELPMQHEQKLKQLGFQLVQLTDSRPEGRDKTIIFINMSPTATFLNAQRFNLDAIYLGILYNNEKWKVFHPLTNTEPTLEELQSADVIIMPGSKLSVTSGNPIIDTMKKLIKNSVAANPSLKIMGVCFGHQFLCETMGGTVGRTQKMVQTVETLNITSESRNYYFLRSIQNIEKIQIAELHEDEVSQLPQNFINVASSQSCSNEIVVSQCGRYFGMQCHADYTVEFLNERSRHCGNWILPPQHEDFQVLRQCMKQFIK